MRKSKATNAITAILEEDDAYAQWLVDRLIYKMVSIVDQNSKLAYEICGGFENAFDDVMELEGIQFPTEEKLGSDGKKKQQYAGIASGRSVKTADWEAVKKFTDINADLDNTPKPNVFSKNVATLGKHLKLSDLEVDCLTYIHAIHSVDPSYLNFFSDLLKSHPERFSAFIALGMDRADDYKKIADILSPNGKLAKYGIIDFKETMTEGIAIPDIDETIQESLSEKYFKHELLIEKIVGRPVRAKFTLDRDFPHFAVEGKKIARALRKAAKEGIKGFNVLLHGPVGAGKTELAMAIVHEAGLNGYAVGEDDESNYIDYGGGDKTVDSQKRLQKFKQAQTLLEDTRSSVAILDEIEDLLIKGTDTDKKADTGSKIELNNVLVDNVTPAILIGNDADKFHSSFHSRIKLPLFVGYQPTLVRKGIWDYHIRKNKLNLPRGSRLKLARMFDAPPRVIAHACETAAVMDGDIDTIIEQIGHKSTLSFGGYRTGYDTVNPVPDVYKTQYVSPSMDIDLLSQMVNNAAQDKQPLSVLIEGGDRVGKTTLASYLAEQANKHISVEDMETMVVPTAQTEPIHHIMIAFSKAAKMDAILVIENMQELFEGTTDGNDRDKMVKEFMSQMEGHKQPVVMIQGMESNMPSEFRAFTDVQISLGKIKGKTLRSAYRRYAGTVPQGKSDVMAIGDITRAGRSVRILQGHETVGDVVGRRIAASSKVQVKMGIVPK